MRVLVSIFLIIGALLNVDAQASERLTLDRYTIPMNSKGARIAKVLTKNANVATIVEDTSKLFVIEGNEISLKEGKQLTTQSPIRFDIIIKCGSEIKAFELVKDEFLKNKVVAHRGAWKHHNAHQNSNRSLRKAIELGCEASEFDVWLSKDKRVVLNHDHEINDLIIEETSLAEMQKIILESNEVMSTLEEYLDIIKSQNKTRLILELKTNPKNDRMFELADSIVTIVHRMKAQAWVDYISFDYRALTSVRAMDASTHTAYLGADRPLDLQRVEGMSGIDYHFGQYKSMERLYERAIILGMSTNVWTVNNEETMKQFLDMDVDFITTDEPEILLNIIEKRK